MILPRALAGKSSIQYVNEDDKAKPKSQTYRSYADAPIAFEAREGVQCGDDTASTARGVFRHQGGGTRAAPRRGAARKTISPRRSPGFRRPADGPSSSRAGSRTRLICWKRRRARYVLRRKPPGKLLPSAHAVDREYPRHPARCTRKAFRSPSRCSIAPTRASPARRSM